MPNRSKAAGLWTPDVDTSVAEYNEWYLRETPAMWAEARGRAVAEAADAMRESNNFRDFSACALRERPSALFVGRMAISPTMARDRFVEFAGVSKNLVTVMERDGTFPRRIRDLETQLQRMCAFIAPLFDPGLFVWLADGRAPSADERDKALLVLGDRLAAAFYLPALRNAQETRQKAAMRAFLEAHGFKESSALPFEMSRGEFAFGRNVPVVREDGESQNLPVDCVVARLDGELPLACVEMKSAGDFTNVNKRRKEEADKHNALRRTHGDDAVFLLQLFGYFDRAYLSFEAAAGIDWAWDHRLEDFGPYVGL